MDASSSSFAPHAFIKCHRIRDAQNVLFFFFMDEQDMPVQLQEMGESRGQTKRTQAAKILCEYKMFITHHL